jgi:hypothetical protein
LRLRSGRLQHKVGTSGKRHCNVDSRGEVGLRPALIAWLCLLCLACARPPDAEAIRTVIAEAAQAAQAHKSGELLDQVSADFIGNDSLDRAQLDRLLRMQMLGAKSLGVSVHGIEVDVQGDRATASFEADVTDSSGRWIADRAATLHFETGWRREHGDWRCYNAKWSSSAR